ncbi:MAG: hypothetical protein Q4D62_07000 [Planctomycetia bacterium]|nr:hypothetical protein [Planctomycetia bacterium]
MKFRSGKKLFWGCCFLGLLAGCSSPEYPRVRWEGNVTLRGKPIPADALGEILVVSQDAGQSSLAVKSRIENGHYVLENVPVGKVVVQFSLYRERPAKNKTDAERGIRDVENLLPTSFANHLAMEAREDELAKDFDIR